MAAIFDRRVFPAHLFTAPELDFSEDLFAERAVGPWFRLGAWTVTSVRDDRNVEDEVFRQTLLLPPDGFSALFDKLDSVGNVIGHLGRAGGFVTHSDQQKQYGYSPFHEFQFPFASIVGEPLAFVRWDTSGPHLFINPDLWLFFELEERPGGSGVWWDPRRGLEVLRQGTTDQENLQIVEIRTDYLMKYLQARQLSLLVGHYRQLLLFDPTDEKIQAFVNDETVIGKPEDGAKAKLENWGLRDDGVGDRRFLQRRLHLWFVIQPTAIDINDPWKDDPPDFDYREFTLPTDAGPVAPARWCHHRIKANETTKFAGVQCDFMDRVYFRQEVLMKYQGSSGYEILDNGSVRCNYWGLVRSTSRLGNELISTGIGDWAEAVPFAEWQHWKQFSVEPPSLETAKSLCEEDSIPDQVNDLVGSLERLNRIFSILADSLGVSCPAGVWLGSVDSLAGRQLKWIYPVDADDEEFLKRATLLSTFVLEELSAPHLRTVLNAIGVGLHRNDDNPPRSLGSRNLLQRLSLIALIIARLRPERDEIPRLVQVSEGKRHIAESPELEAELQYCYVTVRRDLAALAFMYNLRIHGGLAHAPNKDRVVSAVKDLGLSEQNWGRRDYLRMLRLVTAAIDAFSEHLWGVVGRGISI